MRTTFGLLAVAAMVAGVGCSGVETDAEGEGDESSEDVVSVPEGAEQELSEAEQAVTVTTTQVVYVNFGGPTISDCANYCNDAIHNKSFLIGDAFRRSGRSINFAPYGNIDGRAVILRKLRIAFEPYKVVFTTTRPQSGAYTMLVISPTDAKPWATTRGTTALDCKNSRKTDIAFVYEIGGSTPSRIAQYAAHELGHSFGLAHVASEADFMESHSHGTKFTTSRYALKPGEKKCSQTVNQNAPSLLATGLGTD